MKQIHRHTGQTGGCRGGGSWGRDGAEAGVSGYKLSYTEWINKVLLCSTGNYIQYLMINHNGKEYMYVCAYIYITESLCCTTVIQYSKSTTFQ